MAGFTIKVLMLASAVVAMPQGGREEPLGERRAHPSLINNCIAENSKEGLDKVRDCLKCFEETGDPLSEEGLPKAKACTEEFLPRVNTDCAVPLEAMEPDNEELGAEALQCFAAVTQVMAAEECIADKEEADMVESLTDGVICMKEMQSKMSAKIHKLFEKEIKKEFEKFKEFMEKKKVTEKEKPIMPKEDPMRDQMMSLISKRHCEIASGTPEEEASCQECFDSSRPDLSGSQPSKKEYVNSLATCSAKHLSPQYDECTSMMQEMAVDPENKAKSMSKGIFFCYMRVVTKNLVEECSNSIGIQETTAENLLGVMECSSYRVFQWMRKNVRLPKIDYEDYELAEATTDDFYNEV